MKCYSEKDGIKFQTCKKKFGYRTCFTQYDKRKFSSIVFKSSFIELSIFDSNPYNENDDKII